MSESSAVSPESVNKNTPESPKNKVKKKKSLWKILLAIILILVVLVCLLLCGVRAYFRLSVREYYKNSEKTFEIPGLSEGLIPQGLCYDENTKEFLVTGYRSDNQPSQISVVGKESGEEVKRVGLLDRDGKEYCGHVGGISLKGNYLYVAGSEGLLVYSYKDLKAAASGETIQALGIFSTATEDDKLGVAFTHVEGSEMFYPHTGVIVSVSQGAENELVQSTTGIQTNQRGLLTVNEDGSTTREGVFAGGDAVMGARTVVEAVAIAKKVAESMDSYMKSLPKDPAPDPYADIPVFSTPTSDVLTKQGV